MAHVIVISFDRRTHVHPPVSESNFKIYYKLVANPCDARENY